MAIQTMGEKDCCSSIGDIEKHEKFKKLSKAERVRKLQEVYDQYGVRSEEFFIQVKPFIMWTVYKYLRGMHYSYLEDLVNNAYEELIIAFEGGDTTHYNQPVHKEPIYQSTYYYTKCKGDIGLFVMAITGSATAKYRSKNFRKQTKHEDQCQDISDRLGFTDFEINNDLDYYIKDPDEKRLFNYFIPNEEFKKYLYVIKETQPRNNILYHFMLWRDRD